MTFFCYKHQLASVGDALLETMQRLGVPRPDHARRIPNRGTPYIKIRLRPDRQIQAFSLPWQKNQVKTLALRIEFKLQNGPWQHCAVYEDELQRLWPLEAEYREARIANFAVRYRFRLRFYQKGSCAIFEKATATTQNDLSSERMKELTAFLKLGIGDKSDAAKSNPR